MVTICCHINEKNGIILQAIVFCFFYFANISLYCQADSQKINWCHPSQYIPLESHWIEDSTGIVCVACDSTGEITQQGLHAIHVKGKKWKITASYDSLVCKIDERYCECYWFGKFKRIKASPCIQNNFHCNYEFYDSTRTGLFWVVKIYSKSGELIEWYGRIMIGYYHKFYNSP